ncbi:MAG: enoyl-CoA hydratase/isomerase family protein [Planctomycetota bacterium]
METITTETVRAETLDGGRIQRVVLDAGKGNVIGMRVIRDLRDVLGRVSGARQLCAIVLDHAGDHFSFGASVDEHVPGQVEEMLPRFHALAREVLAARVPALCAVRGMCLGGGLEVALLADRVFAAPGAKLGQPELLLGVFAPIGSALLPRRIGSFAAADLLLSGRVVGAEEARALGLVGEIAADPGAAALAWARQHLAPKSASSLRYAAAAARLAWSEAFLADLARLEETYLTDLMATHDAREGIAAFLEKRKPSWTDA